MKRIYVIGSLILSMAFQLYAAPAHFKSGIVVGTKAQEVAAGVTVGDGDLYIAGDLFYTGYLTDVTTKTSQITTENNTYYLRVSSANTNSANGFKFESDWSTATLILQGTTRITGTMNTAGISNTGTLINTGALTNTGAFTLVGAGLFGTGNLTHVTGNNAYVVRIASANTTSANGFVFESDWSSATLRFQGTSRIVSPTISGTLTSVGITNTGTIENTGALNNTGAVTVAGGNATVVTGNNAYRVRISSANTTEANGFVFESDWSTATLTCVGTTRVVGTLNTAGVTNTGTIGNTGALNNTGAVTVTGGNTTVVTGNNAYYVKIASANTDSAHGFVFYANESSGTLKFQGTCGIIAPTISGTLTSVGIANTGTLVQSGAVTVSGGDTQMTLGNMTSKVRISSAATTVSNGFNFEANATSCTVNSQGETYSNLDNLKIGGSLKLSYLAITDSATVTNASSAILNVTAAGGAGVEITLPTAVGNTGLFFLIKKSNSSPGIVTITTDAAETIDGVDNNVECDAIKDFIGIVSNGANWIVVSRYIQ